MAAKAEKLEVIIVQLPASLKKKIREEAKAAHTTMSGLIRMRMAENDEIKRLWRGVNRLSKSQADTQAKQSELFAKMRTMVGDKDDEE